MSNVMSQLNAFVTPEFPLLFTVREGSSQPPSLSEDESPPGVPEDYAEIALAILVRGVPTFLATHVVPKNELEGVVNSLEEGDVRVAVVGIPLFESESGSEGSSQEDRGRPAAFVSVVCKEGRRLTVARILGPDDETTPEVLARHVIKEIARGVQVPSLAATE